MGSALSSPSLSVGDFSPRRALASVDGDSAWEKTANELLLLCWGSGAGAADQSVGSPQVGSLLASHAIRTIFIGVFAKETIYRDDLSVPPFARHGLKIIVRRKALGWFAAGLGLGVASVGLAHLLRKQWAVHGPLTGLTGWVAKARAGLGWMLRAFLPWSHKDISDETDTDDADSESDTVSQTGLALDYDVDYHNHLINTTRYPSQPIGMFSDRAQTGARIPLYLSWSRPKSAEYDSTTIDQGCWRVQPYQRLKGLGWEHQWWRVRLMYDVPLERRAEGHFPDVHRRVYDFTCELHFEPVEPVSSYAAVRPLIAVTIGREEIGVQKEGSHWVLTRHDFVDVERMVEDFFDDNTTDDADSVDWPDEKEMREVLHGDAPGPVQVPRVGSAGMAGAVEGGDRGQDGEQVEVADLIIRGDNAQPNFPQVPVAPLVLPAASNGRPQRKRQELLALKFQLSAEDFEDNADDTYASSAELEDTGRAPEDENKEDPCEGEPGEAREFGAGEGEDEAAQNGLRKRWREM